MRKDKFIVYILFLFSVIFLGLQVFPGIHVGDSPELIAAANILGNAHPPGYPLYLIIAKLFLFIGSASGIFFVTKSPAFYANFLQVFYGGAALAVIYYLVLFNFNNINVQLKKGQLKNSDNYSRLLAGIFSCSMILSTLVYINQSTVAEVFMLNILFAALLILGVVKKKYSFAGFIFGLGMGKQHTLIVAIPAVLFLFYFESKRWKSFKNFTIWTLIGLSVYLYSPIRAGISPAINWGDPSNLRRFIRVITRADYGTFALHGSSTGLTFGKAVSIVVYFFKRMTDLLTLPGMLAVLAGTVIWLKKNIKFTASMLILMLFSGPLFFLAANMKIDSSGISILERFFLLPVMAAGILAGGLFYLKSKYKYILFLIPLYLMINNFTPSSLKYSVLDKYIRDISHELIKSEPLYITRGGVGDDIVFGLAYLKYAEGKLDGFDIYSEYGSIFPRPEPVKGRASFATFSPKRFSSGKFLPEQKIGGLYQAGLLFKNYYRESIFPEGIDREKWDSLNYRQRNIAVNYPYFRARKYIISGKIKAGLKELEISAGLGKDIPWLLNNIGNIYMNLGKDSQARRYYLKAVELDPGLAEGYNNLGNIFYNSKKWAEAINYYKKAIRVEPDAVRYYNLGLTYMQSGDNRQAVQYFNDALKKDPGYSKTYNDLGLAYYRISDYNNAINSYKKGLKSEPGNPNLLFNLANCYEIAGASGKADRYWRLYLENAVSGDPDRERALWYLKN
ncbi:MAG: tetratricopeptide repeat protein [Elusimicrobia bacterium]|jgi:tetratricopeptide (TPR) repeat protein|nr:tetratricopeptide repeat protein [Elusimicrobiota bacterium]